MRLTYKQRLSGVILLLFALFAVCIIISEQREQKAYRTLLLESKLDGYVETIHGYLLQDNPDENNLINIQKLVNVLPQDIRVTIIDENGGVVYDKAVQGIKELDNHLNRPEILKAKYQDFGSNIRMSTSTDKEYMYYARFYQPYFIRVALPYTPETQSMLKPDKWFVYVVLVLFVLILVLVNIVAGRFGKSIAKLRDFAQKIKEDKPLPEDQTFPNDELGEIGEDLVEIFKQKENAKQSLEVQHNKLVQHFQYSEIGLSLFSHDSKKIFANTYFMQYLNLILDKPVFDVASIFTEHPFDEIKYFIDNNKPEKYKSLSIEKNGKIFSIQAVVFDDESFEVTIKDVTKVEKNRLLKQEMTSNVAHELRTPVTSIRGYLETLNDQALSEDKQKQFIDRAYQQVIRLSALIEDVSLLSNIEESPGRYAMAKINILQLVNEVRIDLSDKLQKHSIHFEMSIDEHKTIDGNYTLLYSVFRNLIDNSINYGGESIEIHINNYMEDDTYMYFSYYDTGRGVEDQYLNKLFERFYRAEEGRTRNTGGSGLGLSIVRNAILLHKGQIEVRNRQGGGLEFLFTLPK